MKSIAVLAFIAASGCALAQTQYNVTPSRAFGQPTLTPLASGSPNLVEGRELYLPQSIAFDKSTNPPIMYVADLVNNRVLAWSNANGITKGTPADKVIGQRDLLSTRVGGPSTSQTTGLSAPAAVAVDPSGNLYVADAGNNRILRFPKPFSQNADFITPDLVIGQRTFSSGNLANEGAAIPSAKTLAFTTGNNAFTTGLAFDAQGNLWVADALNNRVLRFPASALTAGAVEPAADFVLGQTAFDANAVPTINNARLSKTILVQPSGLAFADNGDLYVTDGLARVLYFKAPIATMGQAATRLLGIPSPTAADPNPRALNGCPPTPPQPCESVLGAAVSGGTAPPQGLAVLANSVYVADTGNNRVVKYDTPDKWPTECVFTAGSSSIVCSAGTLISPAGAQFIGQAGGQAIKVNQGGQPGPNTLAQPVGLAFLGTDLWIADASNNRVVVWPQSGGIYGGATKVLGQLDLGYNAPNLIEGKELFLYDPASHNAAAGVAVDSTTDPPHLYIADTLNNRILGFRDARKVKPGDTADMVIGQPDFYSSSPNYATHDPAAPTDATLYTPVGLLVDPAGDLFVADAGNARVLRFPRPFAQTGIVRANLVLGQSGFFTRVIDPSSTTMRSPWGLARTQAGHLLVSDAALNRVLLFKKPDGGDFTSGQRADSVIGQPDFFSSASGNTPNRLNAPHGIATDTNDRLYVADAGNDRVSIFSSVLSGELDPSARFTPTISQPLAIAVSAVTGQVWVTDVRNARMLRFPIFEDWFASNQPLSQIQTSQTLDPNYPSFPIAITLDGNDNPIIAESNNRVAMYYIQAAFSNAASYVTRGLTPGMLAYLYRRGPTFAPAGTALVAGAPLPKTLGDYQVLVNGNPAPIFQVLPDRVTFQVPWSMPVTGNADVQLIRVSTGEVLSAATFPMHSADPAMFTSNAQGTGQLAVTNQDGTVNSPSNPAARGSVVSFYGTGIGPVAGAPADGVAAPGPASAPGIPRISMNPGGLIPDANILYYGLVNWFPGVFQLNVKIPDTVPPSSTVQVAFSWQDYFSNDGPTGRLVTTIAVK